MHDVGSKTSTGKEFLDNEMHRIRIRIKKEIQTQKQRRGSIKEKPSVHREKKSDM